MAHNKENPVSWNKDIVYKDEQHFLQAQKDACSELSDAELKEAYKANYAKAEKAKVESGK